MFHPPPPTDETVGKHSVAQGTGYSPLSKELLSNHTAAAKDTV